MKKMLLALSLSVFLTACPMDFATFEVDVGANTPESAILYIVNERRVMNCEAGQCSANVIVKGDGPGRIELLFADGSTTECAIPEVESGYSDTMRFIVEGQECRVE